MRVSQTFFAGILFFQAIAAEVVTARDECTRPGLMSVGFYGTVSDALHSSRQWGKLTEDKGTVFYLSVSDLLGDCSEANLMALKRLSQKGKLELGLDFSPLQEDINDLGEDELSLLVSQAQEKLQGPPLKYARLPWHTFSHRVLSVFQDKLKITVTESSNQPDDHSVTSLLETFREHPNSVYLLFDASSLVLDDQERERETIVSLSLLLRGQQKASNLTLTSALQCLSETAAGEGEELQLVVEHERDAINHNHNHNDDDDTLQEKTRSILFTMLMLLSLSLSLMTPVISIFRFNSIK